MTERQRKEVSETAGKRIQYLIFGSEPILIDQRVNEIRGGLKVNESFDLDRFTLPETAVADIANRLYLTPLGSERRLLIVNNLEEVSDGDLRDFADVVNQNRSGNCLILTYQLDKDKKHYKKIEEYLKNIFPGAEWINTLPGRNDVRRWIQSKIRRDGLNLDDAMVSYLQEEFSNDITGLKNEFEKIENYLHEVGSIDSKDMRDLARGLCDFGRHQVVNAFLEGRSDAIHKFEELQPYIPSQAIMVDAMTRGLIGRARSSTKSLKASKTLLQETLEQLIVVDKRIKTSSTFSRLLMELFILHNAGTFRNGALYGR